MGRLRHRLRILGHLGGRRTCPCCGSAWREFATFNGRARALCLRCGSLERHRALALFLDARPGLTDDARVLHFAPEPAVRRLLSRSRAAETVTCDLDPAGVDVEADITDLPFDSDEFDLVICSHVLEHVPDDSAALAELARVTRPGGTTIVMVPRPGRVKVTVEDPGEADPEERRRRFGQHDHVRIYGPDLAERMRRAGFDVEVHRIRPDGPALEPQDVFEGTLPAGARSRPN